MLCALLIYIILESPIVSEVPIQRVALGSQVFLAGGGKRRLQGEEGRSDNNRR